MGTFFGAIGNMGARMNGFFSMLGNVMDAADDTGFAEDLFEILAIIFGVLGAIALPFAIYLYFKLVSAPDEQQRAAVKKRFVNVLASMMIIVILVGMMLTIPLMVNFQGGGGPGGPGLGRTYTIHGPTGVPVNESREIIVRRGNSNIRSISNYNYHVVISITSGAEFARLSPADGIMTSTSAVRLEAIAVGTVTLQAVITRPGDADFTTRTITRNTNTIPQGEEGGPGDPGNGNNNDPGYGHDGGGGPTHASAHAGARWPIASRGAHSYNHFGSWRGPLSSGGNDRHHIGIDMPGGNFTNTNFAFFPILPGTVVRVGSRNPNVHDTNWHYSVLIEHNISHDPLQFPHLNNGNPITRIWSFYLVYAANSRIDVSPSQTVQPNVTIGRIGRLLHFEIYWHSANPPANTTPVFQSGRSTNDLERLSGRLHPLRVLGGTIPGVTPSMATIWGDEFVEDMDVVIAECCEDYPTKPKSMLYLDTRKEYYSVLAKDKNR
ncbi:MAG: hypothetical protein FWE45_01610 [Firmicutes bacterium]|nr:hypothetical protein [Bacillota bacterium]